MLRKLSAAFAAGAAAGAAVSLLYWYLADSGYLERAGISLRPSLTPAWLYLRATWGGLWGLLLLVPLQKNRPLLQGLIVSLAPTAAAFFYFLPRGPSGMLGLHSGYLAPVFILLLNALWGVAAAYWNAQGSK